MKIHSNARSCPNSRLLFCRRVEEERSTLKAAAEAAGFSERTGRKWLARYRAEGKQGLFDRSSAPLRVANRTSEQVVAAIAALRRVRFTGPEIAEVLELATSTVSVVLRRIGLGRLSRLEPLEAPNRYERRRAGELLHIDIKKLGRIGPKGPGHRVTGKRRANPTRADATGRLRRQVGWEFVHICVDDATRLATAQVLADERARSAVAFLRHCLTFYRAHGVRVERVMTDNGSAYVSAVFAIACRALGIRHLRTRAYRPRTNGKAERFIRTMLREWAYAAVYGSSAERAAALTGWLERYNTTRRHGALGHKPPIARLRELTGNNVAGIYT
jgi:transposase InsO family protein